MKTILSLIAVLALAGCGSTPKGSDISIEDVSFAAYMAAFNGTYVWLKEHPGNAQTFEVVKAALWAATEEAEPTTEQLGDILKRLPKEALQGEYSSLVMANATVLWLRYRDQQKQIELPEDVRVVMKAVADGISVAMEMLSDKQ